MVGKPRPRPAQRLADGVFAIPTNRGDFILVDEADAERVAAQTWHSYRQGNYVNAAASIKERGEWTDAIIGRFVLEAPDGAVVDHINGDPLDNRRANLRLCTVRQNAWNRAPRADKEVPYKGVYRSSANRFRARIYRDGRNADLGSFKSAAEAASAYDAAAIELYGEFARLNFPRAA